MTGVENGTGTDVDRSAPARRVDPTTDRVVRAAAVGLVLFGVWFAAVVVLRRAAPSDCTGWECVADLVATGFIAALAVAAAGWPALWLAGVRPAWPVAGVAPLVAVVYVLATNALPGSLQTPFLYVAGPLAYAVAAFATARTAPARARRAVVVAVAVLALVALLVVAGVLPSV